jgi:ABC-type multidrug transport system ATPase subunit
MSESILKALMRLFALVIDIDQDKVISDNEKGIVRAFLSRQLNSEMTEKYMDIFNDYLELYHKDDIQKGSRKDRKRTSLASVKILGICEQINKELEQKQKVYVIVQLIEFISMDKNMTEKENDFLESVASAFNIPSHEFINIRDFITCPVKDIHDKTRILVINNKEKAPFKEVKHTCNKNLSGEIIFLNIPHTNTYMLRYNGEDNLYLNCQNILPNVTYTFDRGSSIRNSNIETVYYSDIAGKFSTIGSESKISIRANNVVFRFKNSNNGIQDFSFYEESGQLVGIMGGSGVGKSTLLNVLNGNLKPMMGEVLINGYNLYDEHEKKELQGVIGYVPQDDLLIEELTVFQNLFFNARLCLNKFPEAKIEELVNNILDDLDLREIKDLKVGNPLNKVISGGQRKRVNIALELIREPSILFIDEPTSGLSSVDSEVVMNLLKEQTFKGKLIIVNIHQPSSDLYKMFDKVIFLDKGGYQIYYGNPGEAIIYFKSISHHANSEEDQCTRCGNVNPDQVLQIIEAKVLNENGKLTRTRKVSPKEWFQLFREKFHLNQEIKPLKEKIPRNYYSIPGLLKQMKIFFIRDVLSKFANTQYMLISLLEAPLLAVLLGFFTKYIRGLSGRPDEYIFGYNENLPAYLFMSVVVALFLGLIGSSEEIIKDRKILRRESFLNLSRFSYLNSKILIMFIISAIQTITYVLLGNMILGIKGMTLSYWLILFSTSCVANMMGLNISSGFNSVITIYILIPFLLIPQLLLGGIIVKFDKLHKSLTSYEYVPVIGDLMSSRWAYEALVVEQFKNNEYEKPFFAVDQEISTSFYNSAFLLTRLNNILDQTKMYINTRKNLDLATQNLKLLDEQIGKLRHEIPAVKINISGKTDIHSFNESTAGEIKKYFEQLNSYFRQKNANAKSELDSLNVQLTGQLGGDGALNDFKDTYYNSSLADLAKNSKEVDKIIRYKNNLIRKYEPVYMEPASRVGRAHFYAPVKIIGNLTIDTLSFNAIVLWIMSVLFYFALYFDVIRKTLSFFETARIRKRISD